MLIERIIEYKGQNIKIRLEEDEDYIKCIKSYSTICSCSVCYNKGAKFTIYEKQYYTIIRGQDGVLVNNCGGPNHKVLFPINCFEKQEFKKEAKRLQKIISD